MNKKKTEKKIYSGKFDTFWCFAIVNSRLAEIYFDKKLGVHSHCYVKREEFSKREQKMIDADTKKHKFTYRRKIYKDSNKKTN